MRKILITIIILFIISSTQAYSEALRIDINTAIKMLHQNNLNIQAKAADVLIAERNKITSWNTLLPKISLSAGSSVTDDPYYYTAGEVGPNKARFNFDMSINAGLDLSYGLGAVIKNNKLQYQAQEISLEMTVRSLELNTKNQFYSLLYLEEQMKIMKKGIDLAEKLYKQEQLNFQKGLITEMDVLRAQFVYASQQSDLSTQRTQYENLKRSFKVMLGIQRTDEIVLEGTLNPEIYSFNVDALISKYLPKSLSLRSMNKDLEIMLNEKNRLSHDAYTPVLSLGYSINPLSYNPWANDYPLLAGKTWNFDEKGGIGNGVFTIALSFSVDNFVPGSKNNVEINNIKDQIAQMKKYMDETVLQSEVEIINSIAMLNNSVEQLRANKLNVELARKVYEMTINAFQLGTKDALDVESAQNDLLKAEVAVIGEQFNYLSELLNLEYRLNTSVEDF
jgi:outer membrane protein TolC